jgi:hypothetical protein
VVRVALADGDDASRGIDGVVLVKAIGRPDVVDRHRLIAQVVVAREGRPLPKVVKVSGPKGAY